MKEFYKQDPRTPDGMRTVARCFGFLDEWDAHVRSKPGHSLPKRFYNLIKMKASFANSGRGGEAVDLSPREGMHRMFAELMKLTGSKFDGATGRLKSALTLQWQDFQNMGLMNIPAATDELMSLEDAILLHIYDCDPVEVPVEICYFNVSPNVASSERLTQACKLKSEEISKSKTSSAKRSILSLIFEKVVQYELGKMTDFKLEAIPIPPTSDSHRNNEVVFTSSESSAMAALKGKTIQEAFKPVKILTTEQTYNYIRAPFNNEAETKWINQFPCICTVRGITKTLYPPLFFNKRALYECSPEHMNLENILLCHLFPKVMWILCLVNGCPDGGDLHPSESSWFFDSCVYVMWFHFSRFDETDDRLKTHGCISKFGSLGGGGSFHGHNALIGGMIYITQCIMWLFYHDTNAVEPFAMNNVRSLHHIPPTIAVIKANLKGKEMNLRKWLGRCHLIHPSIRNQISIIQHFSKCLYLYFLAVCEMTSRLTS